MSVITIKFVSMFFAEANSPQSEISMIVPIAAAIISAFAVIAVGILTYILNNRNFARTQKHNEDTLAETREQNRKNLEETRRIKKKEAIEKVLNEFYMPVHAYLQVTEALAYLLRVGKPEDFRTLTHLLNPSLKYKATNDVKVTVSLSNSDKEIIKEIIEIEKKMEEIIVTKTGLVSDESLMFNYETNANETDAKPDMNIGLIPHLIAHFRVLRLANEGKIIGEIERYKTFVFPRKLPDELKTKIKLLQEELDKLNDEQPKTSGK